MALALNGLIEFEFEICMALKKSLTIHFQNKTCNHFCTDFYHNCRGLLQNQSKMLMEH